MTFSDKLKRAREIAGFTQQELGDAIGVTKRTIASYESDGAVPRKSTLAKLASALKVSTKYLSCDECTDPLDDIERDSYVLEARALYGEKGARDMEGLLSANAALFAGGELSQEQKDAFFEAIMASYLTCKEEAKKKFGKASE